MKRAFDYFSQDGRKSTQPTGRRPDGDVPMGTGNLISMSGSELLTGGALAQTAVSRHDIVPSVIRGNGVRVSKPRERCRLRFLEVFGGTGSMATAFREAGFATLTVDLNQAADVQIDVRRLTYTINN